MFQCRSRRVQRREDLLAPFIPVASPAPQNDSFLMNTHKFRALCGYDSLFGTCASLDENELVIKTFNLERTLWGIPIPLAILSSLHGTYF